MNIAVISYSVRDFVRFVNERVSSVRDLEFYRYKIIDTLSNKSYIMIQNEQQLRGCQFDEVKETLQAYKLKDYQNIKFTLGFRVRELIYDK